MALLDSIRSIFGGRNTPPSELAQVNVRGWQQPPNRSAQEVLSLSQRSIALLKPTSKIRDAVQRVAFTATVDGEPAPEKSVLHQVLTRPNAVMSGPACRALEVLWLDLLGESFAVVTRSESGGVDYMPVPPTWVTLELGEPKPYKIRLGDLDYRFSMDEVVHMRRLNPMDPYGRGVGLGLAAIDEVETEEYAAKFAKSFFYNRAAPEYLIALDGGAHTGALVAQAQAKFDEENRGFARAWRTKIMGGTSVSVHQLTSQFDKLNMVDFRRALQDFVRELYGVPPELFGQLESSNRATITAALEIFGMLVVNPRCSFLCDEYNTKLIPRLEALGFGVGRELVEYKSAVPRDRDFTLEVMGKRPEAFTVNEWREVAGLKPRQDGDVYLRQADHWEAVDASDIISVTPIKAATPPPLPSSLKGLPTDRPVLRLIKQAPADLELILRELQPERMRSVIYEEGQQTLVAWAQRESEATKAPIPDTITLNPFVTRYLDEHALASVKEIDTTTRNAMRAALIDGVRAGEGTALLIKRLRELPEMSRERAELIARTEVGRAANAGKHAAYSLNPAIDYKRWVATSGSRTRPAHMELSGQIKAVDQPFTYGIQTAMYPGGWGSAAMDARCRCTIAAHFIEDETLSIDQLITKDTAQANAFDEALKSTDERMTRLVYDALQAQLEQDIIPAIRRVYGQEAA